MATNPLSWTPPSYPPTNIENDGTRVNRYDCRKTLAYTTDDTNNVNNVYMLYWIVTEDGRKYHLNSNAGLTKSMFGTFLSLNDFQTMEARGASTLAPAIVEEGLMSRKCDPQSIVSPSHGDQWTGTEMSIDYLGVKLDVIIKPTGGNFYYGGGGGIQLAPRGPDPDPALTHPGWSWYWANPTTRLEGTLTVDGEEHRIDTEKSFALFERQWGNFHIGAGYWALWFYLETGEVVISWGMEPTSDGKVETSFASIWHPNGIHEMIPVGSETRGSDISMSAATGLKYFNHFFIDLPARNASFTFKKWFRNAELVPDPPELKYITISESYGEGTAMWNGNEVKLFGHAEQLSTLK
ncbi:hypothetical protein FALCPG4_008560 [Fusarium falciforme]